MDNDQKWAIQHAYRTRISNLTNERARVEARLAEIDKQIKEMEKELESGDNNE